MNGVDVGRLPVGFLSGATATVALGTLVEWLVPSVGGWSTGVAVACLTVMAIVVPPLWKPLAWTASVVCVLASLPFLVSMLGAGRGCGYESPTVLRTVSFLVMTAVAVVAVVSVVREHLPDIPLELLGVGWFGAVVALGAVSFGRGPEALHHDVFGPVLMLMLGALIGAVVGVSPPLAACLSGVEMIVLMTPKLPYALMMADNSSSSASACLMPGTDFGLVLGFGSAFLIVRVAAAWVRKVTRLPQRRG